MTIQAIMVWCSDPVGLRSRNRGKRKCIRERERERSTITYFQHPIFATLIAKNYKKLNIVRVQKSLNFKTI